MNTNKVGGPEGQGQKNRWQKAQSLLGPSPDDYTVPQFSRIKNK